MRTAPPDTKGYERKTTGIVLTSMLLLSLLGFAAALHYLGFEWDRIKLPGFGVSIKDKPALNVGPSIPGEAPTTDVEALPDAADLLSETAASQQKPADRNAAPTVASYLSDLQVTELDKRALIGRALQALPGLRSRLLSHSSQVDQDPDIADRQTGRYLDQPGDWQRYNVQTLPIEEWDRFIQTQQKVRVPPACRALQDAYLAHLRSLRDLYSSALDAASTSQPVDEKPAGQPAQKPSEAEQAATDTGAGAADMELGALCAGTGIPKTFDISAADR